MFDKRKKSAEIPGPNIDARLDKERAICFGSFRLLLGQRLLLEGNNRTDRKVARRCRNGRCRAATAPA